MKGETAITEKRHERATGKMGGTVLESGGNCPRAKTRKANSNKALKHADTPSNILVYIVY